MNINYLKKEMRIKNHIVIIICLTFFLMLSGILNPSFADSTDTANTDDAFVQSEDIDVTLSFTKIVANEKVNRPSVEVKHDNEALTEGIDYDISYSGDGIAPGKYPIEITFKGPYEGIKTLYYFILPKAPSKTTATLYGHDDVKLSWSKVKGASGYYVYYKKSSEQTYTYLGSTLKNYYNAADLNDHVTYDFKIIPYLTDSNTKYYDDSQYKTASVTTKKNIKAPSKAAATLYGHDDVKISWGKVKGASGYYVYYKKSTDSTYTRLGSTSNLHIKKANLADGTKYHFKIVPRYKVGTKNYSGYYDKTVSITTLKTLTAKISRNGFNKVTVRWKDIAGQSGYQISRSTKKNGTNIICTYKTTSGTKARFSAKVGKSYYYKARAYKISNGKKIYGPWSNILKLTLSKNYYPKIKLVAKNGNYLDVRKEAGQAMYGYSIFQGSCTDGKYGYYVLYNRNNEKCKIAKMRLSDNKVVKTSGVLNIHHGNDLTYNSKTGKILAVHMTEAAKTIAIINPKTLKHEKNQTIRIPSNLLGASREQLQKITGFNAIAYNEAKDQYVLRIINVGNYLITDKNLKPIKYVTTTVKKYKKRIYAGLDVANGYILSAQAASATNTFERYNVLQVHDWSGKFIGTIYIRKGYELESAYNVDGVSYVAFYREYYSNGKLINKNYIYKFTN